MSLLAGVLRLKGNEVIALARLESHFGENYSSLKSTCNETSPKQVSFRTNEQISKGKTRENLKFLKARECCRAFTSLYSCSCSCCSYFAI